MVDKKNPARRGAGKRSAPGLRKQPGRATECEARKRGAGAAETAGCEGWRDSGAAGKNGAGQGSR